MRKPQANPLNELVQNPPNTQYGEQKMLESIIISKYLEPPNPKKGYGQSVRSRLTPNATGQS
jgi:hypothetical protein